MKTLFLLALASLSLFMTSVAQDFSVAAAMAADKVRGSAMRAADTNTLQRILADDLRYTHSNGFLETKTTHIKSYIDGLRYTKFETTNVVGHLITPDVVVLNGIIDQTKGTGGKMTDYHLLFQAVYRKKGSDWQLASLQTAAPPAPAKKP
jgi:hypothetical protein